MMSKPGVFTLILVTLAWALPVFAQELTPRAYWPAPEGTQVLTLGYIYTSGDIVPDPSLPITGVDSKIDTVVLGYLRTISLWGRTANFVVQLPYSEGETAVQDTDNDRFKREYQGMGDLSATLSVNFLGAPTMTREDFALLRQSPRPILGASVRVVAPTGKYDTERFINTGANRWAIKPELGYIQPLTRKWLLEAELGVWFFGDNDNFRGFKREQDPIGSVELHLVRRFTPGFWLSLDGNYYRGGRSSLDGERLNDLQRDSMLGLTLVAPITRGHALKASYSIGSVNDDDEDFYVFTLSYQHIF
jgi:hypothetical protein